jgi:lipopolysaccharide transport system permease protein
MAAVFDEAVPDRAGGDPGMRGALMVTVVRNLMLYRELLAVLVWKSIAVRYKQAYLGLGWAILKPLTLVLVFVLVRSFVGIDSGNVPYPLLTFVALMPWTLFQESTADGVNSIVSNYALIRKIYFPREVFPVTSVLSKVVEFAINVMILAVMMVWYEFTPSLTVLWIPVLVLYTVLISLAVVFFAAALNASFRDVSQLLPASLSLLLYASPIIYPLQLVKDKLLVARAAGSWSDVIYFLYTMNPIAGVIDGFQRSVLQGLAPNPGTMLPGLALVLAFLPLSYRYFKRVEADFADVI